MIRNGIVRVRTGGNTHCGTETRLKIRYSFQAECDADSSLDERGFLFDQLTIVKFFEQSTQGRLIVSCETAAKGWLQQLVKTILGENPACKIRRVALTVSPFPYAASMTFAWENKNTKIKTRRKAEA